MSCAATILHGDISLPWPQEVSAFSLFHKLEKRRGLRAYEGLPMMSEAELLAVPGLEANDVDASLVHEAAIGKIAGDQLIKLMTLGLTEAEAEEQIINGFLK